jgi:hypothetical protein
LQNARFITIPSKILLFKQALSESDIPILIAAGLLKPLGKPGPNAPKFFARVEIERCAHDIDWLNQATRCVAQYWKRKRDRQAKEARFPTSEADLQWILQ